MLRAPDGDNNNAQNDGFRVAVPGTAIAFPADHGAHPDYRTEWWYITGNLETETGRHFGFQITFFRFGLAAEPVARASAFAASQIWMAHFTVTDTREQRFYSAERFSREALDLAGATAQPFRVWLGDWAMHSELDAFLPLQLAASHDDVAINLRLDKGKPVTLQGEDGLDRKGPEPGNASFYYSFTHLPAAGTLSIGAESFAVDGSAWLDREWSTSALGADLAGWDWFGLQLEDGRDLMYYRLRQHDGGISPFSGGVIVGADGGRARLAAADAELQPLDYWTSPESGARYPIAWRMRVPAHDIELEVRARLAAQELRHSLRYWEGAVQVRSNIDEDTTGGQGYLELVGY